MKRVFDIFFSLFLLLMLAPFFFTIAVFLKFTGEGEVIYKQQRIGLNGVYFSIYKFATMLKNSENIGSGSITLKNDSRVLFFGGFLRKYKINELPQLINVLVGSMSLVGPRPLTAITSNYLPKKYRRFILTLRPGLTGLGSLFFSSEENLFTLNSKKSHEIYKNKVGPIKAKIEFWYFQNRTLYLDIKIIFATIIKVFYPKSKIIKSLLASFTSTHIYEELIQLTER
jgi:lipopolysaccharide/colanic/teichoic acid biosynthesis glycosyltransferase